MPNPNDGDWFSHLHGLLSSGPVAFGENHINPNARNTAIEMIKANVVTKLFVEKAEFPINGRMPGEILREHAAQVRNGTLGFNDTIDEIGLVPANLGSNEQNPTSWEWVVRWAAACGVDVYYFDRSTLGDAGSDENMAARNRGMAWTYIQNTDEVAIGALLINGSDHLNGDSETGDLHVACGISNDRVVIFSNDEDAPSEE